MKTILFAAGIFLSIYLLKGCSGFPIEKIKGKATTYAPLRSIWER